MRHAPHFHLVILHAHRVSVWSLQLPALLKVKESPGTFFFFRVSHSHSLIWISSAPPEQFQANTEVIVPPSCVFSTFPFLFFVCWTPSLAPLLEAQQQWRRLIPAVQCALATGVSAPQGSLGEWVPAEVCLNARGSICPRRASLALMDMSVLLLIVGLAEERKKGKEIRWLALCIHVPLLW